MYWQHWVPGSVEEALGFLAAEPGSCILAGGTDLVLDLRQGRKTASVLVDISDLEELKKMEAGAEWIRIGAGATFRRIIDSAWVKGELPVLRQACLSVGAPQIRNQGTIGGNIVHGSPAADSVPALLAYDSVLEFQSIAGRREESLDEFLARPAEDRLRSGEILTAIRLRRTRRSDGGFVKLGRRNALAISRMTTAITMEREGNRIKDIRLAFGSLGKAPFRAEAVEEYMRGKEISGDTGKECLERVAGLIREKLGSRTSAVYKREAVWGVVSRALALTAEEWGEAHV